ncbi:uncharacterized protein N0V89_012497 [Didymosphaeria variabile]|uniref:Uncharacterized protein n=1 Tax=Didymosphaeria variabile TaxID=1932322 RepID=A0A9W8X9C5_9PLEO|nr:uncharacterized protein N0V89_012497 [Didymosphaeria variabile]KAJ4344753.1 hypothetical protein N0V89_012497 [Didymosphaeria variabile]
MKYKDRRQYGPDQPVEFLEFRPTLVPTILVNKLWADEGTSILWLVMRRYPHLPSLKHMPLERRQYYANKVHYVFSLSPPPGSVETLDYLTGLAWPNLKSLELEVDLQRYGSPYISMLHAGLEHVELSGYQSGGSKYFTDTILPTLFNLSSIRIGPDTILDEDPVHVSVLYQYLDACPSIKAIEVKSLNLMDKDALFTRLSQRQGLESLQIDLDPGVALIPLLSGPNALPFPFASLTRCFIMCYPEVALALPIHLRTIEELQIDIARAPISPHQPSDFGILEDMIAELSHCPSLRILKVGISSLADDFPSSILLPRLSGSALGRLGKTCPKLEDVNLLATEPSAIDGSSISSEDFDSFCKSLPYLRNLSLKLQPTTASALQTTALQSLGRHCPELEVLRLKVAFQLDRISVPGAVPQILVSDSTFVPELLDQQHISVLFPKLTHLALARPDTALAPVPDSFTNSVSSHSTSIVDPTTEEDLVRSWAHPLLIHFPRLEILEAWGDFSGEDNESLNYFLPTQEILASTWEFLSGIEQDLWEDDEESLEEGDSWNSLEDWEKASLINEFAFGEDGPVDVDELYPDVGKLAVRDEESEGMITPGRTLDPGDYFQDVPAHG